MAGVTDKCECRDCRSVRIAVAAIFAAETGAFEVALGSMDSMLDRDEYMAVQAIWEEACDHTWKRTASGPATECCEKCGAQRGER